MTDDERLAQVTGYADRVNPGEQGSIEWLMQRVGFCTASEFKSVMAVRKDKKEAAARYDYRIELVCERLTGEPSTRFVSQYMKWGTEHEPAARMAYEAHTGAMVLVPGFTKHPTIPWCGGSVDGLVDDDGIIEIKAPDTTTHIETLLAGDMPEDHRPQVQGYLWITGRQWADFISYDPRLPAGLDLFVKRIKRDDDYIAELAANVMRFLAEAHELHQRLLALKVASSVADTVSPSVTGNPAGAADEAFDLATQI